MLDASSEPSPEVLRSLHADHLRQLRNRTLGWIAVAGIAVFCAIGVGFGLGGPFWLAILIAGAQAARAGSEWSKERRVDPIVDASAEAGAVRDRERSELAAFQQRIREQRPGASITIASIVVLVTVIEWLTAGSVERTVGRAGLVKPLVSQGEWWRLFTATFIHANILHLFANVSALLTFGRVVEAVVPRAWVLVTYIVAGLTGSLASWWLFPNTAGLGASGAVMGIVGFLVVLGWRRPGDIPASVREAAWMTIVTTGYIGAMLFFMIDNAAHAGGLVAGAVLALAVVRRDPQRAVRPMALRAIAAVSIGLIVLGAGRTVMALVSGSLAIEDSIPLSRDTVVPVSSVSATVVSDRGFVVVVTNSGTKVLEAYEIEVGDPRFGGRVMWRDDCCIASDDGIGAVKPGGSVRIPYGKAQLPAMAEVRIRTAVFADGSFEGSSRTRDQIVRRRKETLEEAAYWMLALDSLLKVEPGEAAERLRAIMSARAKFGQIASPAAAAFRLPNLIRVAESDPARLPLEIARTKARIATARQVIQGKLK